MKNCFPTLNITLCLEGRLNIECSTLGSIHPEIRTLKPLFYLFLDPANYQPPFNTFGEKNFQSK